jgi:hypothetical protein
MGIVQNTHMNCVIKYRDFVLNVVVRLVTIRL